MELKIDSQLTDIQTARVEKVSNMATQPGSAEKIEDAARSFESLLVHQMMNAMWSTVPKEGLLSSSREEELFRDMLNQALSDSIAEGRGIGLRDVIVKDMTKNEHKT